MKRIDLSNHKLEYPKVPHAVLLNQRQKFFVSAMIGPANCNQAQAARMAGYRSVGKYTHGNIGSMLMKMPWVQRAVSEGIAMRSASPDTVRLRLIEIASSTMANFITVDDEGNPALDFKKASRAVAIGQIKEFKEITTVRETDDGPITRTERTLKLHDPVGALTTLARMHGMLVDKHEVTGADGGPIETVNKHAFTIEETKSAYEQFLRPNRGGVVTQNGDGESLYSGAGGDVPLDQANDLPDGSV